MATEALSPDERSERNNPSRDREYRLSCLRRLKHVLCVSLYALLMALHCWILNVFPSSNPNPMIIRQQDSYGPLWTCVLYGVKYLIPLPLYFCVLNCLGVTCISLFPPRPRLQRSPLLSPFLCFRVVTRGLFPQLVKDNMQTNLELCQKVGLHNFLFEVVTDHPLHLPLTSRVRETVVPPHYQTPRGTLFKARALQYGLDMQTDLLSDDDWIVHLDEETLVTEDSLVGILNFVSSARHDFGQGVITYSRAPVVSWLTTLGDSVRVGVDYGSLRFTLGILHKPLFSWKGSFVVARAGAEREVSYDHGPEGSIAEDCYLAMVAFQRGYSFGWVAGQMLEKSPFTLKDYVQQRRRWIRGIYLTAKSPQLLWRYKLGPVFMSLASLAMPLTFLNAPFNIFWPVVMSPWFNAVCAFTTSTVQFLFLLGTVKSFSLRRHGPARFFGLCLASLISPFIMVVFEVTASLLAFWGPRTGGFYIVKKELNANYLPSVV